MGHNQIQRISLPQDFSDGEENEPSQPFDEAILDIAATYNKCWSIETGYINIEDAELGRTLYSSDAIAVQLDDSSEIGLCDQLQMPEAFQLRGRLRAVEGDIVVSGFRHPKGYEEYNATFLGLGGVEWVLANDDVALARSTWNTERCFRRLVEVAVRRPMYIHPYMASRDVWELANRLSSASGESICVLGPPPDLCRLSNNKIWFYERVEELLGSAAVVKWGQGATLESISAETVRLAKYGNSVVLRHADSTAGLGLTFLDATRVQRADPNVLVAIITQALNEIRWTERSPLLIVGWDYSLGSVSAQMFLLPDRKIVHEGMYEQIFYEGAPQRFRGGRPARLPSQLNRRLVRESYVIGKMLLALGFRGRCSVDAILVGSGLETAEPKWVDCNGRWGGSVLSPNLLM